MGNISPEQAEEMKRRVVANGGSVGEPTAIPFPLVKTPFGKAMDKAFQSLKEPKAEKPFKPRKGKKMNKTESELNDILVGRHDVVKFEGIRLKLAPGVTYTPDFFVSDEFSGAGGGIRITLYEAKGPYIRPDAWMKLKLAVELFPQFRFILAQRTRSKGEVLWNETILR